MGIIIEELVLVGFGKTSQPFAQKVAQHLERDFHFSVYLPPNLPELRMNFLDNETRLARPAAELTDGSFRDKLVYIVQDTRIYDNRLVNISEKIEQYAEDLDDSHLRQLSGILTALTKPKEKIAPTFGSTEHNPDRLLKKLYGTLDFVKDAGARHVGVSFRKSSYEWSHNHIKALNKKGLWEMDALKQTINELALHGANSLMYVHPHAPKEGLMHAGNAGLNYLNINHQGNSYNNGEEHNLLDLFSDLELRLEVLYPDDHYLKQRQGFGEYNPMTTFINAPDLGAYEASGAFAKRNNLRRVSSEKFRLDEGESNVTNTESIDVYLSEIAKTQKDALLTFIILDDKINTAGTADDEILLRKKQVEQYNNAHGTNFKVKGELWCTHLRNPYLNNLRHDNLDKIVILDTVPYFPHLEEQLYTIDEKLFKKVRTLRGSSYQVAAGIAMDYRLNVNKAA